jgi:hypothetical protein
MFHEICTRSSSVRESFVVATDLALLENPKLIEEAPGGNAD